MRRYVLLWRILRILVLGFGGALLIGAVLLVFLQTRLIYMPRPYDVDPAKLMSGKGRQVRYEVDGKPGVSYYFPPADAGTTTPSTLWVMFGGNAALALDWMDVIETPPDPQAGYLLIEYPGYGQSKGSVSPGSVLSTTRAALEQLKVDVAGVNWEKVHLAVLGHSLGCAAALQLAAQRSVDRIVLISPFTSMSDMARRAVGAPLCWLLRHRYDNVARLQEISSQTPRPSLTIIHGDADNIVPVQMSQALASRFKGWADYHEVPGADHNFIITSAGPLIRKAMAPAGIGPGR